MKLDCVEWYNYWDRLGGLAKEKKARGEDTTSMALRSFRTALLYWPKEADSITTALNTFLITTHLEQPEGYL